MRLSILSVVLLFTVVWADSGHKPGHGHHSPTRAPLLGAIGGAVEGVVGGAVGGLGQLVNRAPRPRPQRGQRPRGDARRHGPAGNFLSAWTHGMTAPVRRQVNKEQVHRFLGRFGGRSAESFEKVKEHLQRIKQRREVRVPENKRRHLESIRNKLHKDLHPVLSIQEINQNAAIDEYMFESDIHLTEEQAKTIADAAANPGRRRAAGSATATLWDKTKPIPYTFNKTVDAERIHVIERALASWQKETCLTFKKDGTGNNKIEFFIGEGCYSSLGRVSSWKTQPISIGDGCQVVGIAAHEIMHALGVLHTQGRVDRDDYVTVNLDSIQAQAVSQFAKLSRTENDNRGVIYDYGSIMHYGPYYFWNGKSDPSLVPDDVRYQNAIGNRREIQFSDAKIINLMYKCNEKCAKKLTCVNSGYQDHVNCNQCRCPPFFTGTTCQNVKALTNMVKGQGKTISLTGHAIPKGEVFSTDEVDYEEYYKNEPEVIMAPAGHRLNLTLIDYPSTPVYCYSTCRYAGIEIVDGNFENSGMIYCCNKDKGLTTTSKTNRIGIRSWSAPGVQLKYTVKVVVV